MMKMANKTDEAFQVKIEEKQKEMDKISWTKKLIKYNNPKILIVFGVLASFFCGAVQPCLGVVMS